MDIYEHLIGYDRGTHLVLDFNVPTNASLQRLSARIGAGLERMRDAKPGSVRYGAYSAEWGRFAFALRPTKGKPDTLTMMMDGIIAMNPSSRMPSVLMEMAAFAKEQGATYMAMHFPGEWKNGEPAVQLFNQPAMQLFKQMCNVDVDTNMSRGFLTFRVTEDGPIFQKKPVTTNVPPIEDFKIPSHVPKPPAAPSIVGPARPLPSGIIGLLDTAAPASPAQLPALVPA